ncbi:MAG: hypothetical protein ABR881_00565 [Candidatus Sulfotelmatobacter sp.]
MKRSLRNTSRLAPLTPTIPNPMPLPTDDAAIIYTELLWWRDRALAAEKAYHTECKRFTRFRAKGIARGIAKKFTPNHNPKEAK